MTRPSERPSAVPVLRRRRIVAEVTSGLKSKPKRRKAGRKTAAANEPTCRVNDKKARNALRTGKVVNSFVDEVADLRAYTRLTAPLRPGGTVFKYSRKKERNRMRAVLHQADRLAQNGELRAALEKMRGYMPPPNPRRIRTRRALFRVPEFFPKSRQR